MKLVGYVDVKIIKSGLLVPIFRHTNKGVTKYYYQYSDNLASQNDPPYKKRITGFVEATWPENTKKYNVRFNDQITYLEEKQQIDVEVMDELVYILKIKDDVFLGNYKEMLKVVSNYIVNKIDIPKRIFSDFLEDDIKEEIRNQVINKII